MRPSTRDGGCGGAACGNMNAQYSASSTPLQAPATHGHRLAAAAARRRRPEHRLRGRAGCRCTKPPATATCLSALCHCRRLVPAAAQAGSRWRLWRCCCARGPRWARPPGEAARRRMAPLRMATPMYDIVLHCTAPSIHSSVRHPTGLTFRVVGTHRPVRSPPWDMALALGAPVPVRYPSQ
ncbi:hypothetical protein PLESTF_000984800 [Pleodorina starrii]|nr:hypothetical protein PLESTF_000984800 [Pleodorina starrii]